MPAGTSDHLFYLVKSLSASEINTYWRFYKSNMNTPKSNGDQADDAQKIFEALSKMETYDEAALRAIVLGKNYTGSVQKYLNAKRIAETRILTAIEQAPENQSLTFELEKVPNLIEQIEFRGVDYRVRKLLNKYLPLAERHENFDVVVKLLKAKANFILRNEDPEKRPHLMNEISRKIQVVHQKQVELLALLSKRQELKAAFNQEGDARQTSMNEFFVKWDQGNTSISSIKSQVIFWEISRRWFLYKRQTAAYVGTLNKIISCPDTHPDIFEDKEYHDIYIDSVYSMGIFRTRAHQFDVAESLTERLYQLSKDCKHHRQEQILKKIMVLELYQAKERVDLDGMIKSVKKGKSWYYSHSEYIGDRDHLSYARLAGEAASIAEDFREAYFWLNYLTGSSPNKLLPQLTNPANLWGILVSFEIGDTDLLESNLRKAIRLNKKQGAAVPVQFFIDLGKELLKEIEVDFRTHSKNLEKIEVNEISGRVLNAFPFHAYLKSKLQNRTLAEIVKAETTPKPDL